MARNPVTAPRGILRILWLGAVAAVMALSLLPSASPPLQALDTLPINDTVQHLAAYAFLAFLPALYERRATLAGIALLLIFLGVGLEFGQRLVESRSFEVRDMTADAGGVLVGIVAGWPLRDRIRQR